jgi:hypothetical protein
MENLIWDGVPAQRTRKSEKYDFAVVTMSAIDKPGAGRKFTFNKAAQDVLGINGEDRVSFGFSTDRTIIAVRKAAGDAGLKLTKTCTLSDKRTYDFIAKILDLDITQETDLEIVASNGLLTLNRLTWLTNKVNDEVQDAAPYQEEEYISAPAVEPVVEEAEESFELAGEVEEEEEEVFEMPTSESEESTEDVW